MNQKQQPKQHSPAPATIDEIRISYVRFVTKAMSVIPIRGNAATSIEEYINARKSGTTEGYDITWIVPRRVFRFERYDKDGVLIGRRWVHESRVETWEDLQDAA